jgi:hypothetical protein
MKREYQFTIALLAGLAATALTAACSSADDALMSSRQAASDCVSVSVECHAPGDSSATTRGSYDYQVVKNLYYAAYDAETGELSTTNWPGTSASVEEHYAFNCKTSDPTATVRLMLRRGSTYNVVFYAASGGAPYEFDPENQELHADYDYTGDESMGNPFMDDRGDVFYTVKEIDPAATTPQQVTLTRIVAQVNIGTTLEDWQYATKHKHLPTSFNVEIGDIYETMDLLTGEVSDQTDASMGDTYNFAALQGVDFPISSSVGNASDFKYLARAYVLVGPDKEATSQVAYRGDSFSEDDDYVYVENVPLQRNHRTNIYGRLLSYEKNIHVVIDPTIGNFDYGPYMQMAYWIWDSKGTFELDADLLLPQGCTLYTESASDVAVLNLNGHTIRNSDQVNVVAQTGPGTLYINGPGEIICDGTSGIGASDGKIVLNGDVKVRIVNESGYFNSDASMTYKALLWTQGTGQLEIRGGYYAHNGGASFTVGLLMPFTDVNSIKVYGGSFENYNPKVGGEEKYYKKTLPNAIHDFVADGYGCYHATEDGKDIYYVHAQ